MIIRMLRLVSFIIGIGIGNILMAMMFGSELMTYDRIMILAMALSWTMGDKQ